MSIKTHISVFEKGVEAWNLWRAENPHIKPILRGEHLGSSDLDRINLSNTDLSHATITRVSLIEANFTKADLSHADLGNSNLLRANLTGANLHKTNFCTHCQTTMHRFDRNKENTIVYETYEPANLREAVLVDSDLSEAILCHVDLTDTNLHCAILIHTNLREANLTRTDLSGAKLTGANLSNAILYAVNMQDTSLANCRIHGISAWKLDLDKTIQTSLIITDEKESEISVDNLEVAQFIYLLLHNRKIRNIIDTVANKAVLILGRFSLDRKAVLDAIREVLRKHNYVPILFDFEKPAERDMIETITTLAGLSKFVIADMSEPKSTPLESHSIIPNLMIPFVPIIQEGENIFSMFADLKKKYDWVLDPISYKNKEDLIANFEKGILGRVEGKFSEIHDKKLKSLKDPIAIADII